MFKKSLFVALGLSLFTGCAGSPTATLELSQAKVLKSCATTPNTLVAPVAVMNSIYALMKANQVKYGSDLTYSLTAMASRDGFQTKYASATEVIDPDHANLQGGLTFRLFNHRKLGKPSAGEYSYYLLIEASSPSLARQKRSVPAFSLGKGGTLKCSMK